MRLFSGTFSAASEPQEPNEGKSRAAAVHEVSHSGVSELTGSGTAAHTALAILNYIMHGAGIFIAYMNGELKGGGILPVWKRTSDIERIR